jgi:hypothetical protein
VDRIPVIEWLQGGGPYQVSMPELLQEDKMGMYGKNEL